MPKKTTYPQRFDGGKTKINTKKEHWKFACCDCGLIHDIHFRIMNEDDVELTVERNARATGQFRRWNHVKINYK